MCGMQQWSTHWVQKCGTYYGCTYHGYTGYGGALEEEVLGRVHDLLRAEPLGEEDEDDRLVRVRVRVGVRVGVEVRVRG